MTSPPLRYLSVCSGIEAATVAFQGIPAPQAPGSTLHAQQNQEPRTKNQEPAFTPLAFAEIEPFPSAVLAHHYPTVPNLGDLTKYRTWPTEILENTDLLCGGTPCQAFSIAGKRESLADERGNLTLTYVHLYDLIDETRHAAHRPPALCLWENVPGVLNTDDNAFGCLLGALAGENGPLSPPGGKWLDAGYVRGPRRAIAWRLLDAQHFGLAQRRERIFLIAGPRDGFNPAAVLFESQSLRRDTPPRRQTGQGITGTLSARPTGGGGLVPDPLPKIVGALPTHHTPKGHGCAGVNNQAAFSGHIIPQLIPPLTTSPYADNESQEGKLIPTLRSMAHHTSHPNGGGQVAIAFAIQERAVSENPNAGPDGIGIRSDDCSYTLESRQVPQAIAFQPALSVALRGREGGGSIELGDEVAHALRASQGGSDKPHVLAPTPIHARPQETHPGNPLHALRQEIGAQAFAEWGLGILDSLHPAEILRPLLHERGLRLPAFSRCWLVHCALSRPETCGAGAVQSVREAARQGCPSQGWQPPEQFARELGAYLSALSQPGAQTERFMSHLWAADESTGLLRETLSAFQKVGRSHDGENQSASPAWAVRRLTPEECEFLQGFPRNYTRIPYRGKPAADCPDGPRYKALGNSWAVPCASFIAHRLHTHLIAHPLPLSPRPPA